MLVIFGKYVPFIPPRISSRTFIRLQLSMEKNLTLSPAVYVLTNIFNYKLENAHTGYINMRK